MDLRPSLLFRWKSSALIHFVINIKILPHQARDLKAFKSALDEEEFDVEKKHLVGGVNSTLMQVGLYVQLYLYLSLYLYLFQLAVDAAHGKDEFVEALVQAGAVADKQVIGCDDGDDDMGDDKVLDS